VEKQMRILMQENGITKANYAQNREKLQTLLNNSVYENTRSVEQQIIENCAGQEYARLSPKVKERLMAEVLMPRQSFEDNFVKNFTRLPDEWQPEFEDYLHG
jgi:hypothetical protein